MLYRVDGLTEPAIVYDTFVSGLGMVERVDGGLMRLTYYADTIDPYSGARCKNIVLRMVRPLHRLGRDTSTVQNALTPQLVI